ncbi:DUF1178 family protein [Sphingomonas sp. So64.6b]|uniref:DUF1178 family protein n=1 Tax=Sphingomonas sp. So64.6b TaxID=2997354 RepID=UPI001602B85E|nr:DUF1178 family protein [Sphingomonas sp. So64.6b]QNA83533.1 DUF1178 family protein [Sphingomonas sp. So64.6b]
MIVFDLKCTDEHVFEAWFGSSVAFEAQRERGLIACPYCGATDVTKAVMAPSIPAKGNTRSMPSNLPTPEAMKAAFQALAAAQVKALETSEWVGRAFADRARAMHVGDAPVAPIHGQSTAAEVKDLVEEGVPIAPLIVPVVPPEALN